MANCYSADIAPFCTELVAVHHGFREELAQDVLEIITVFSARLYGSRSRKNQKLLDGVKHAVEEASS